MTNIEQKALELVNEIEREEIYKDFTSIHKKDIILNAALHRAIEQHEAFRQEVSDALEKRGFYIDDRDLGRFIIAKPDPLVETLKDMRSDPTPYINSEIYAKRLRAALAKRGLEIREKSDG